MAKKNKKIYFIDGNAFCYRAFYAIKELTTSRGVPTNAIYGFINIFHKLIKQEVPDMLVAVFDSPGETDRHKKYEEYKIHRKPMPDDLVEQLPWIKKVVQAYNVPIYELKGYEADDIIATLAEQAKENDVDVTIVTSDKDALQLVGDKVQVLSSHAFGDKVYGSGDVKEKYGVGPELMVDLMALTGDTSDNVPGVKGIGKITASKLINQYGSLKGVYENLETLSSSSTGKKLSENKEMAELSRELVELNRNVPVVLDLNRAKVIEPDTEKLAELYAKFEFVKLLREITPVLDAPTGEYNEIVSDKDISDFSERVKRHGKLCMVLSLKSPGEEGSGAALSFQANSPLFISFLKKGIPEKIKELLEDKNIKKTGYDLKRDKIKLKKYGICLEGIDFDVMIADYLTDPANISYELSAIVMRHLGRSFSGKAEKASEMCQNNRIIYDLADKLNVILEEKRLGTLFTGTEMPLVEILAEMEIEGVTVDRKCLKERSESLGKELGKITKKIYELAGQEFNINSPKQLQTVLYEKLELPVMKKTKTGFSTDESVLRKLSLVHELPKIILDYRELNKLKTGYYDSIIELAEKDAGKLHAHFNQAVTSTGRLSSSEPNLQNIPIKTKLGKEIRRAFVPMGEDRVLVAADYSQVELRILAHLSEDKNLIKAFKNDADVHNITAAEIFEVEEVTPEMRSIAKTVNFGIVYGMSSFGLAKDLEISFSAAQKFIDTYFKKYEGVKRFINKTIKKTQEIGYVTTLLNRRRYIPEINNSNERLRNFSERTAINTPVQGSAADLIKLAMIECARKFHGTSTKMIIQVHDELVFDVPKSEVSKIVKQVREIMENVVALKVPLKVDIEVGRNWLEMEPVL